MSSSTPHPPAPPSGSGRGPSLSLGAPRNRGGRGGARTPPGATAAQRADAAIRGTDNDATGSRLSAMLQQYLPNDTRQDPYTALLASSEAMTSATLARRAPVINVGTYLRCRAVDILVAHFLMAGNESSHGPRRPKQIVSLGAGSDSRFWRLHSDPLIASSLRHYVELDFAQLTAAKIERIVRHKVLSSVVVGDDGEEENISSDRSSLQTKRYTLIACDLRTLASNDDILARIQSHLDPNVDTLILAECVLAYLSPAASDNLLACLGQRLATKPCAVCYEMCVAGDTTDDEQAPPSRFGHVMLSNLESRGLSMPGSRAYATVASHAHRFERAFQSAQESQSVAGRGTAQTLKQVWRSLDDSEKQRISRLEGLDEVEELEILLAHYAISWYAYDKDAFVHFLDASL